MPTSRLFIALCPDDHALEKLAQINKKVVPFATLRMIPQDQRHLTLCFLGEVEACYISAIKDVIKKSAHIRTEPALTFKHLEYGANPQYPNLIWLRGENSPWIIDLWQELKKELTIVIPSVSLDRQGKKSLLNKHFLSHLTLARFQSSPLQNLPVLPSIASVKVYFKNLALTESCLTPQGPIYNVLASVLLSRNY